MWKRKDLKRRSKRVVKRHYWHIVLICFVVAYLTGAYAESGTTTALTSYDPTKALSNVVQGDLRGGGKTNSQIVSDSIKGKKQKIVIRPLTEFPKSNKKYHRGVFAGIFNSMTESGSFLFGFLNALNSGIFGGKIMNSVILIIGAALSTLYWFWVKDVIQVFQARYFLEAAVYEKVPLGRSLLAVRVRRWFQSSKIMFFKWLYTALWALTIVGGIIMFYSYRMIPFIVAENPNISRKEAFLLSRQMMKGNKWKTFMLDVSFLGWDALSICTFGIVGIFYSNGYQTATITELYFVLREHAIRERIPGSQSLNDRYIGLHPAIPEGTECMPEEYPAELFSIPEHEKVEFFKVDYRRDYTLRSLILLFFTFSMIGWFWEVGLHLATTGEFVNRGTMTGPWLPIYGSGGVLILVLLKKAREHPVWTFLLTVVVCGCLEYAAAWYLETAKGMKWWDYSGYLLNLDGRICAEGLLVFGLGGCAFIYIAAPLLDEFYKRIAKRTQIGICAILLVFFAGDKLYTSRHPNIGEGITSEAIERDLDQLEKAEAS